MSDSTNWMDALNALMEERNRYEQWLAQLDARKGTTPTHVFSRVRGDYEARLTKVLDQLAGRATELQEHGKHPRRESRGAVRGRDDAARRASRSRASRDGGRVQSRPRPRCYAALR